MSLSVDFRVLFKSNNPNTFSLMAHTVSYRTATSASGEEVSGQQLLTAITKIKVIYQNKVKNCDRPQITCSDDAYRILHQNWDEDTINYYEEFKVLILNRSNRVLGVVDISRGGLAGTVADPKVIYGAALTANGSSLILAHNHPSGNLTPSEADIRLTHKLKAVGEYHDLPVLDHLIVTDFGYKLCGISAVSIIFNELLLMPHDTK